MQRFSTMALMTLLGGGLMAQQDAPASVDRVRTDAMRLTATPGKGSVPTMLKGGGGAVYFSEDFANGLAGNNGVGPWTTSGPDGAIWLYDTDGPNGFYSATTQVITSTTAANGFMMFDSDAANTVGGQPTFNEWVGSLESPVLDLSAAFNPRLEFEMRSRFCCNDGGHFVDVSTDGGATWPTRLDAEFGVAVNNDPGTFTAVVNLECAIVADPSNVKFRFTQDGSGGMTHYHWQIDDVQVVEGFGNDVKLSRVWLVEDWDDYDNTATRNLEYTRMPLEQAGALDLSMAYTNEGAFAQPNAQATAEVFFDGTSQGTFPVTIGNLAQCAGDTVVINTGWVPSGPGNVSVVVTLGTDSMDADLTNNAVTRGYVVTDTPQANEFAVMGVDTNARDGQISLSQNAAYSLMGTLFEMENTGSMAYGVALCFGNNTTNGSVVNVYLDDDVGTVAEILAFEVMPNMITPAGGANWIPISFDGGPVNIDPTMDYQILVENPGADTVAICTSGDVHPGGLYGYDNQDATLYRFIGAGNPALMARLHLAAAQFVGLQELSENGLHVGALYPNPATESTTVRFELDEVRPVSIQVHDVNGRLVLAKDLGNLGAGEHRHVLSTNELGSGMYNCTVTAGPVRLARRLVVTR